MGPCGPPAPPPLWRPLIQSARGNVLAEMYGFSAAKNMHVDPHLAPRLMEVQIGFDCEALHLSSPLTRTDVQWGRVVSFGLGGEHARAGVHTRVRSTNEPV